MQTRRQLVGILLTVAMLLFAVAACAPETEDPIAGLGLVTQIQPQDDIVRGLATVESLDLALAGTFPVQVNAIVRGILPDSCTQIGQVSSVLEGSTLAITLRTERPADAICANTTQPFEKTLALAVEGLPAGVYTVTANGTSARFELSVDNRVEGLEPEAGTTSTPAPDATPALAPTAESSENQTSEATAEPDKRKCKDEMAFVRDMTVKDDTRMEPGQEFVKTWRLRNIGTCTWTQAYALVFANGDQMSGPDIVPFPKEVEPGKTIDISATLIAPATRGNYQGNWKLKSLDGTTFGVGNNNNKPFWVRIQVTASATPTPDETGSNIRGRVWHDLCKQPAVGAAPLETPPSGCTARANGSFVGNGIYEEEEPRIAGYEVDLGAGACPSTGLALAVADINGAYAFANLDAGTYCVSIDPLSDFNLPIFIPGEWTYPENATGSRTIRLDGIADVENVDFGWDYQFAP